MRLALLAALGLVALFAGTTTADTRTNIILMMADDVGYECFGCYGSTQYRTPRIDQMARAGLQFEHCYSQPLCTPSRVKLMTGLSNVRNYSAFSVLNRRQRTLGQYLQAAGYKTMVAGKWQLLAAEHYSERFRGKGSWPEKHGFDHTALWQVDKLGSRFWKPLLYIDGKNQQFGQDEYGPEIVNNQVLEFIERNHEQPFFVYYPMILVHSPFVPTPDSDSRNSKDKQKNFEDMVAYMDKMIGRVVDKTQELGIAERTLIMFTGDNGTHRTIQSTLNGVKIQGGKGQTTDAGTRVPLVAYWPGTITARRTNADLIDFSDFLPTCLQLAGTSDDVTSDGRSFLPQLRGQPGQPREWLFCYYNPRPERTSPQRFVRNQRYKLYGDGRFYDVQQDVLEQKNVVNPTGAAAQAKTKLAAALASMPDEGQTLLQFDEEE